MVELDLFKNATYIFLHKMTLMQGDIKALCITNSNYFLQITEYTNTKNIFILLVKSWSCYGSLALNHRNFIAEILILAWSASHYERIWWDDFQLVSSLNHFYFTVLNIELTFSSFIWWGEIDYHIIDCTT